MRIVILISLYFSLLPLKGQLILNEFSSKNGGEITDFEGDAPDWIEIYNPTDNTISLGQYSIYDDVDLYTFPSSATIGPEEYLVIFASDKDTVVGDEIHTNFKISREGEEITLFSQNYFNTAPEMELYEGFSAGRAEEDEPVWIRMNNPTPGEPNEYEGNNLLHFSKNSGFYTSSFDLQIIPLIDEDEIWYTTNGMEPAPGTSYTHLYQGSFEVTKNSEPNIWANIRTTSDIEIYPWVEPSDNLFKARIIKAALYDDDEQISKTQSATYFITPFGKDKYPCKVVSLVFDQDDLFSQDSGIYVPGVHFEPGQDKTGNYYQKGDLWTKHARFEFFNENGGLSLQQEIDVRIHGNLSRTAPQKSLRLYAKKKYGPDRFDYPFFEDSEVESFKRLILRTSMRTSVFHEAMVHDIVDDLSFSTMDGTPCVVFVNGEYWGIHNIRERFDKYYFEDHYGVDKDSLDHIWGWGDALEGSQENYSRMFHFCLYNEMSDEENYEEASSMIDIPQFIEYMATEIFFGNRDWPTNNIEYWKDWQSDTKWNWILIDLDGAMKAPIDFNSVEWAYNGGHNEDKGLVWSNTIFRRMLENKGFENQFLARFKELLHNEFSSENILAYIQHYSQEYDPLIEESSARWTYPESKSSWELDIENLVEYARFRPCFVKDHLEAFFNVDLETQLSCEISGGGDDLSLVKLMSTRLVNDQLQFSIRNEVGNIRMQIIDVRGKPVMEKLLEVNGSSEMFSEYMGNLRSGVYLATFQSSAGYKSTFKIIKG